MMGGQWLEVLRGELTHEKWENEVQYGLRERVGNQMQGYAIKEYQYGLTEVNLGEKLNQSERSSMNYG